MRRRTFLWLSGAALATACVPSWARAQVPPGVTGVATTLRPYPSLRLSWVDNSTTEIGFGLERQVDSGPWTPFTTVGPEITTYVDAAIALDAQYCYRVRALGGPLGDSEWSNVACGSAASPRIAVPSLVYRPRRVAHRPRGRYR